MFAGIYPIEGSDYDNLKTAMAKLTLNDASVTVLQDTRFAVQLYISVIVFDFNASLYDYNSTSKTKHYSKTSVPNEPLLETILCALI